MRAFLEIVGHAGRSEKRSVEIIGPAVIGANEFGCAAKPWLAQYRTAMAAAIVKGADFIFGIANDQHRPLADIERHVAARFWQFALHTCHQPAVFEDRFHVKCEGVIADVKRLRQRMAGSPFPQQSRKSSNIHMAYPLERGKVWTNSTVRENRFFAWPHIKMLG